MKEPSLFRPEVVERATRRLEGKVVLSTPISVRITTWLLCAIVALAIIFASTASFSRKETLRGWVTWSSGLVNVRARSNTVITAIAVNEGDWVREGQTLAWADASRLGGVVSATTSGTLITSPVTGKVLTAGAQNGMVTNADTTLFLIAPEDGKLIARMLVPSRAVGFLKENQDIRLAVDAFPYQRFGTLSARIRRISGSTILPDQAEVPFAFQEASYLVDGELQSASISAYGNSVRIENGMQFSADIVIDRRTLLEWLLDPLYAAGRAGT
jgi:multidrug efflux pump subunit AcrA (membrane-fusion protein)